MSVAELSTGGMVAGKYRIESVLGRGGMGAVYLATNVDLGRRVAIKVLLETLASDAELLRRFRQEARAAAAIGHPGIVDVLDLGTTETGEPFIVMEALEGETLAARIVRERRMDIAESVAIVAQALDALAAAHAKDVLHRDLKPENLFLVTRPVVTVKILDFGISKLGGDDDVSLTRTGAVFGTPLFMSAEQARGAKHVTAASDIYSVGAILYQMLTGRTPFLGASYNELIANVLTGPLVPIGSLRSDLPVELAALIDRMLSRDAAARPQSAHEARTLLLDAARDLRPPARRTADASAVAETAADGLAATAATAPPLRPIATPPADPRPADARPADAKPAPRRMPVWVLGAAGAVVAGAIAVIAVARGGRHASTARDAAALAPPDASRAAVVPDAAVEMASPPDAAAAPPPDAATAVRDHHPAPTGHPAPVDAGVVLPDAAAPKGPLQMDPKNPFP